MDSRFNRQRILEFGWNIISYPWRFYWFVSSLVYKASKLLDANKERILALFFFVLEAVSVVLDLIGKNKVTFLLAAFLLSAFGFAITLYSLIVPRTDATIKAETQLKVVEIVFSIIQLIVTIVQYLLTVLEVKNDYNASVFPLAFSVIAVVFIFIKDGNIITGSPSTDNLLPLANHQPNMPLEKFQPIAFVDSVVRRSSTHPSYKEVVIQLEPKNEEAKRQAMGTISCISGVDSISMDMKENKLRMIGDIDPVEVVIEMRTICQTELVSVRPAKMPEEAKKSEDKMDVVPELVKVYGYHYKSE